MRRVDYPQYISESEEMLLAMEKRHRGKHGHDRIRMLYLLKSGQFRKRSQLAGLLGYSERNLQRWWKRYMESGLEGLLAIEKPGKPRKEYITPEAWEEVLKELTAGDLKSLRDVRNYLAEKWGIVYKTDSSISLLFQRRQVKFKAILKRHKKSARRSALPVSKG